MKITMISDTHNKHKSLNGDLPGGDILLHAGDISSMGHKHEIESFLTWFDKIDNYDTKVFIAGNHDWGFQTKPDQCRGLLTGYKTVEYLEDEELVLYLDGSNGDRPEENVRIYGSPWQPEFYNWAFNLPRNGPGLQHKWNMIPENTDILITHGPAWGFVDDVEGRRGQHLGCELLAERIKEIKPKIHLCGHIHSGTGHYFDGHTHYFNASVLNEQYIYTQSPWNIDWNPITNEIVFL
jgi:3',5'-cyclic AMP phosphodiesterase CpdA